MLGRAWGGKGSLAVYRGGGSASLTHAHLQDFLVVLRRIEPAVPDYVFDELLVVFCGNKGQIVHPGGLVDLTLPFHFSQGSEKGLFCSCCQTQHPHTTPHMAPTHPAAPALSSLLPLPTAEHSDSPPHWIPLPSPNQEPVPVAQLALPLVIRSLCV